MTINLKEYAREYNALVSVPNVFPRQKAKWIQGNMTALEVINVARYIHGPYFFMTGSCGILASVMDILFRDENSLFHLLITNEESETVNDITDEFSFCHGQLVSTLSYEIGFDHVIWANGEECYDISVYRSLSDIITAHWIKDSTTPTSDQLLFNQVDPIEGMPIIISVSPNENKGYSDVDFHQKIVQGTSYGISIHELISEIHDFSRSKTKRITQ